MGFPDIPRPRLTKSGVWGGTFVPPRGGAWSGGTGKTGAHDTMPGDAMPRPSAVWEGRSPPNRQLPQHAPGLNVVVVGPGVANDSKF